MLSRRIFALIAVVALFFPVSVNAQYCQTYCQPSCNYWCPTYTVPNGCFQHRTCYYPQYYQQGCGVWNRVVTPRVVCGVVPAEVVLTPKMRTSVEEAEYWCRVSYTVINPLLWEYLYENCENGSTKYIIEGPNEPLGNCLFADQDSGCMEISEIDIEEITVGTYTFNVSRSLLNSLSPSQRSELEATLSAFARTAR